MSEDKDVRWVVREEASQSVIVALFVRQALGIRDSHDLPALRDAPIATVERSAEAHDRLALQWQKYWNLTVAPRAHTDLGPLELVEGFGDVVALPVSGADELRAEMTAFGADALAYARAANERHNAAAAARGAESRRPYVNAIAALQAAKPSLGFELNVEILPLAQRGVWWIGPLTVAVTDRLRSDVAGFDRALSAIVAELG